MVSQIGDFEALLEHRCNEAVRSLRRRSAEIMADAAARGALGNSRLVIVFVDALEAQWRALVDGAVEDMRAFLAATNTSRAELIAIARRRLLATLPILTGASRVEKPGNGFPARILSGESAKRVRTLGLYLEMEFIRFEMGVGGRPIGFEFERFAADLFTRYQAEILESPSSVRDHGYDLKLRSANGVEAVVEIKLYQTLKVGFNVIRRTFDQIERARQLADVRVGILVTNARVSALLKAEAKGRIEVYDFDVISFLVSDHADLADRWERLSQEGFIYRSEPLPPLKPVEAIGFLTTVPPTPTRPKTPEPDQKGQDICSRLRAIKVGKGKPAIEFEQVCIEALRYLFDEDLINWSPQKKSHGQLHRYDLIARISSENDFWNSLIADHRTRYVIFEFKNYRDPITQGEVYSTEKYLFPMAMRSTGIIVARNGANRNAVRVIHGAFREAGKLIVILDLEQVCDMLHRKDGGDDPSTVISDVLEDLLVGLER